MQLNASHIAESVLDVKRVNGMDVQRQLTTHELCIALGVLIGTIAFRLVIEAREIDEIRDAIEEGGGLEIDEMCGIIEAYIALETVFGTKLCVADFVLDASLMNTVAGELANRRSSETSRNVETEIELIGGIIDNAEAAGDA